MGQFLTSFKDAAASTAGGGLVSGALNLGLGQLAGALNARRQWKYQKKQMNLQFDLNERAADAAQAREMENWQTQFDAQNAYNDPSAQAQRLANAGLNVGATIGGAGVSGVSSMSPAASGPRGGVSSPSGQYGPTATPATSLSDSAQAYYYMAAARKLDRETPGAGQTEELLGAQIRSLNTQTDIQEFQLGIEQDLRDITISTRKEKLENLKANTADLLSSADLKKVNASYLGELSAQAAANTVLLNLEALLREKQIEMQEDVRQEIRARIHNYYASAAQSRAMARWYNEDAKYIRRRVRSSEFRDYAIGSAARQQANYTGTAESLLRPKFMIDTTDRAVGRLLQFTQGNASVLTSILGVPGLPGNASTVIKNAGSGYFTSNATW